MIDFAVSRAALRHLAAAALITAATPPAYAAESTDSPATAADRVLPGTAPAPAPEPLCAILQPELLKSEIARPLADSKKTFLVPAREGEFGLTMLSPDQFRELGIGWDAFLLRAKAAASRLLSATRAEFIRNDRKEVTHAVLRSDRHHLPSVILAPEFVDRFRETLGTRLVVVIPNHYTVYVFSRNFGAYRSFGPSALEQYELSLWPCSREVFEVTPDGIRCLGAFDDGLSPQPAPAAGPRPSTPTAPPKSPPSTPNPTDPPKTTRPAPAKPAKPESKPPSKSTPAKPPSPKPRTPPKKSPPSKSAR